jgi:hypothetical protein
MSDDASPLRILFVAGWGRSGSTLFTRMLDQVPGFQCVGEIRDIWRRGGIEDRLCGCGAQFSKCDFWVAVGDQAFGGWDQVDHEEMWRLRSILDRPWSMPFTVSPGLSQSFGRQLQSYVDVLTPLFRAFRSVSGAEVIVEASKHPSFGFILAQLPNVDLRLVHLVRDSRGVVHSWEKQVTMRDRVDGEAFMKQYSAAGAAARYALHNTQSHLLARRHLPYLFLRYEDVVVDPREKLELAVRHAGVDPDASAFDFIEGNKVWLGRNHTVAGNPMRFRDGPIDLRIDDEWAQNMSPRKRAAISAITAPLLLRYHYPFRAPTPAPVGAAR